MLLWSSFVLSPKLINSQYLFQQQEKHVSLSSYFYQVFFFFVCVCGNLHGTAVSLYL